MTSGNESFINRQLIVPVFFAVNCKKTKIK